MLTPPGLDSPKRGRAAKIPGSLVISHVADLSSGLGRPAVRRLSDPMPDGPVRAGRRATAILAHSADIRRGQDHKEI